MHMALWSSSHLVDYLILRVGHWLHFVLNCSSSISFLWRNLLIQCRWPNRWLCLASYKVLDQQVPRLWWWSHFFFILLLISSNFCFIIVSLWLCLKSLPSLLMLSASIDEYFWTSVFLALLICNYSIHWVWVLTVNTILKLSTFTELLLETVSVYWRVPLLIVCRLR